jgi:hypothetical protein
MSRKPPVEETFSMPPALNQAASTDDLMALIRSKQENIKPVEMVPSGTVPNRTEPHYTIADDTTSRHAMPDHTAPDQTAPPVVNPESPPKRKLKTAPWDDANPKVPVGFNFRMDQRLHAKAVWLCENMPAMSQQKLYRMAVEEKIEELLKKYYKE